MFSLVSIWNLSSFKHKHFPKSHNQRLQTQRGTVVLFDLPDELPLSYSPKCSRSKTDLCNFGSDEFLFESANHTFGQPQMLEFWTCKMNTLDERKICLK